MNENEVVKKLRKQAQEYNELARQIEEYIQKKNGVKPSTPEGSLAQVSEACKCPLLFKGNSGRL